MKVDATTDLAAAKRFRAQVELALAMNQSGDGPECSLWQARAEADAVDDGDDLADDVLTRLAMVAP